MRLLETQSSRRASRFSCTRPTAAARRRRLGGRIKIRLFQKWPVRQKSGKRPLVNGHNGGSSPDLDLQGIKMRLYTMDPIQPPRLEISVHAPHGVGAAASTRGAHQNPENSRCAFRSLTDVKWGEFKSLGFGGGGAGAVGGGAKEGRIDGRLRFDLTENARAEHLAK
ncbi:hypothetical protein DFH06DRAFT_210105 [Mycena polygramma]|nr:hypothetical protein DFH06DRAFT_210105 [Mycena polygramma]